MKTIGKIKLNQFSENALKNRHMNALRGGGDMCYCSCNGCPCTSWDGSGPIPPGQSSNQAINPGNMSPSATVLSLA